MNRYYPRYRKSPSLTPEQRQALTDRIRANAHSLADDAPEVRKRIASLGGRDRWLPFDPSARRSQMALVRAAQRSKGGRS
jgi:hypothetical protein